ncbi:mitochondrial carrier [Mrakia frigida]|uniref:mitochondrial carrier n=1 Tax=Mrakia frigida TaxID=29902 RepID=UPI003FCC022D
MALSAEEKGKGRAAPGSAWFILPPSLWEEMFAHKTVVSATTASLVSTFLGYPLDSLKARLQTTRGTAPSIPALAAEVMREEGIRGYWRGCLIPLMTISIVRTTSFSIYAGSKEALAKRNIFASGSLTDVGLTSFVAGTCSGSIITMGSCPFELVKVRRQLEVMIANEMGVRDPKPLNTRASVEAIVKVRGWRGMYTGFVPHSIRDTFGTGLYFAEYDVFRNLLGRLPNGDQGVAPSWLPIPNSLIPFFCGSAAGVSSWALIYPFVPLFFSSAQARMKRALAGKSPRGIVETFTLLARGPDPLNPQPIGKGVARLYRGLGVSAARSCLTHGMLWLIIDNVQSFIERGHLSVTASAASI